MSSPGHQQSNGKAESHVKIFKRMLQRTVAEHQDQWLALLELRNTPRQDVQASPAQILFGHATRTIVPSHYLKCTTFNHDHRQKRRLTVKRAYDKHTLASPPLQINQRILFQSPAKKGWEHGLIIEKLNSRSYVVQSRSGTKYRRNRVHIRIDKSGNYDGDNFDITHPIPRNSNSNDNFSPGIMNSENCRSRERRPPLWFNDYVM